MTARLRLVRSEDASTETAATPGMIRRAGVAASTVGSTAIFLGETHLPPGVRSGAHHHGESETGIYVVSGNPVFVFSEDGAELRLETKPGDYVFVPPYVPHIEENPSADTPAVVVLARSTQEAIVVNLPGLQDISR